MNNKKKITIIGNNNDGAAISDGGRIKIRLYESLLKENNFDVEIIDLCNWKKHFLSIVKKIKRSIKNMETIVIMAGPNGSRIIIPLVYVLNKRFKTRVVFCPVGIGSLDKVVRDLSIEKLDDFLLCKNFQNKKDKKFSKYLASFDMVVLENKVLEKCYKSFYEINNTGVLTNFRVCNNPVVRKEQKDDDNLHCVYLSRICIEKGIVDLLNVVDQINNESDKKIFFVFYGDIQLSNECDFYDRLNEFVHYNGVIKQEESYDILPKYDLFVLPTKYHGEGTPGSLVESLISGTPVLLSNYSQSRELIIDGYNGYTLRINSNTDLKSKLLYILNKKNELVSIRGNVIESSKKFMYKYVQSDFLKMIGGID